MRFSLFALILMGFSFLGGDLLARNRRNSSVQQYQNHTYVQPANPGVSAKVEPPANRRYVESEPAIQSVEFDYKYAINNPSVDSVKIKIKVTDKELLEKKENLFAFVQFSNLRHDKKVDSASLPIQWDNEGNAFLEVPNLKPESVYKMKVSFQRYNADRTEWKPVKGTEDYYAVTSGKSLASKGRFKVTTAGLIEVHDWAKGRKGHHNFPYDNVSGGWCGTFQHYCAKPYLKVQSESPSGDYQRWGQESQGSAIPTLAKAGSVHGNHGYISAHKLMVLDYSEDSGRVYTVEGNWGNSVGINIRSPQEIGTMGIITDGMVWPANVEK